MAKKMTIGELKAWSKTNTWQHAMDNSKGMDGHSNYSGGVDKADWVVVAVGRNRDSEIMDESNFFSALEMLGGESDNVEIARFGHWACGWFELILVNPKSLKSLRIAHDIKVSLERYGLLDDSDYSERESEQYSNYAEGAKKDLAESLSKHFGVKNGKVLEEVAYRLNMEVQYQNGNDACVNIYSRVPEKRGVKELINAMEELRHDFSKSKVFKTLDQNVKLYYSEMCETVAV